MSDFYDDRVDWPQSYFRVGDVEYPMDKYVDVLAPDNVTWRRLIFLGLGAGNRVEWRNEETGAWGTTAVRDPEDGRVLVRRVRPTGEDLCGATASEGHVCNLAHRGGRHFCSCGAPWGADETHSPFKHRSELAEVKP